MKSRLLLSLFFALFITFTVTAQYCGNSGSQVCTPTGNLGQKYFTPSSELMCINRSQQVNRVVQIAGLNLNRISSLGGIPARWVRIDSILNLPDGLCWSTSDALNMFDSITNGCLKISGITNAAPGQYKLKLMVTIKTVVGSYIGDLDGVSRILSGHKAEPVYLRLVDASGITCPEVDTLQTDSNNYLPFATNYDSVAQISGKIFFDANQNGIYDSSETGAVGRMLDISTDFSAISNTNGDFTAYIPSGLHIIKPRMGVLAHTPDSIVVLVNNTSTSYTGNNIALTLTPNYCEGSLSIIGGSQPPRPGFSHQLSLQYHNTVSGSPVSQTILLNYNPGETYITAVPIPNTVDTATHVITWLVSNIASGASWQANVTFYTPASVPNGSINHYSATVNNSNCNSTNAITTAQDLPVRGSFDPNDKAASPAGEGPGGNIPPLSELTYTIRFQNTGTYQAETVKVMDTLSNFADVKSLKVLAASHNYQVLIKGNAVTLFVCQHKPTR
jgi:hypothetical protein